MENIKKYRIMSKNIIVKKWVALAFMVVVGFSAVSCEDDLAEFGV